MKTILVPTDFSPVSLNAVNYAVEMARSIGADILLVHMYQLPVPFTEVPMPELSYDEIKKAAEERVEELKTHIIQTTAGSLNVLTESRLGDPVEEMEKICDSVHPFAVVMGTQGATGLERLIMGSTALTAIRHLKYPVIVVPAETSYKAIRKLGLACDFQDVEESTPVNYIKNIVQEFGAELHILNVDNNKSGIPENVTLKSGYLERRLGNIVPTWHFLEADNVTEGITEFAANNHLDMIMVIPKKHQLLESIFRKSNSKEFLQQSHIPIVSVHD